jgi:hypothetical protein
MSSQLGRALVKEAVSKGRLTIPQSRKGRRPISVDKFLQKEKEGTLYKMSAEHKDQIPGGKADSNQPSDFSKDQIRKGTKVEMEHVNDRSLAEEIAMDHLAEFPDYYDRLAKMEAQAEKAKEASYQDKLPWYTSALGGTTGYELGKHLAPAKYKHLAAVGGLLGGTALGLESGTALGKRLDRKAKVAHAMREFLEKNANSNQPASRLFLGSARGPEQVIEDVSPFGISAATRVRPGDSPSRTDAPGEGYPRNETALDNRQLNMAMKVAGEGSGMGHLVDQKNQYPSRAEMERQDPVGAEFGRIGEGFQRAGANTPVFGYNPNWNTKVAAEEPYILTVDDWEKVAQAYEEIISEYDGVKLASASLEELHKEAFMGALRKVLPQSKKIINVGGEVVDLRQKILPSFKSMGHALEQRGKMFQLPKGVTPEMARAAGNMRGGSAGGRIFGQGLHDAGHHMAHTGAVGAIANPLGKPIGGFLEGVASQSGKELQRVGQGMAGRMGSMATSVGGGLQRHAGKIGLGGEILGAAGTATALGHAVSPAAQGLALAAKKTGLYAPGKQMLGSFGFNLAKDVAATGAEGAVSGAGKLMGPLKAGAQAVGRMIPGLARAGGAPV